METKNFDHLVQLLPKSTTSLQREINESYGGIVQVPVAGQSTFIEPNFRVKEPEGDQPHPKVLLISAAAAVGKSFLARELAYRSSSFLVDLGGRKIGSEFFSGLFSKAFGRATGAVVGDEFAAGSVGLILDAADEALVSVRFDSFAEAIEDLAYLLQEVPDGKVPCVVLGRPDTIELVELLLSDLGVPSLVAEVQFFDADQSKKFVLEKAQAKSRQGGVAQRELMDFVDYFFDQVTSSLGSVDDEGQGSRSLVGYAPVLDSLVTFYLAGHEGSDDMNPMQRLMSVKKDKSGAHVWGILSNVMRGILEREAFKFARSMANLHPGAELNEAASEFYSPESQVQMLLTWGVLEGDLWFAEERLKDYPLAREHLSDMRESALRQLQDHPMRRSGFWDNQPLTCFVNPAFRDYCVSQAFDFGDPTLVLEVVGQFADLRLTPSPMLAKFCLIGESAFGPSHNDGGVAPLLPAEALGPICESHSQLLGVADYLSVRWGDADRMATRESGEVERRNVVVELHGHGSSIGMRSVAFDPQYPLTLTKSISRASISLPDATIQVVGEENFTFGPDVVLLCDTFQVNVREFRAMCMEDQVCLIRAGHVTGVAEEVFAPRSHAFQIRGLGRVTHPWTEFAAGPAPMNRGEVSEIGLKDLGLEFRKYVDWFARGSMYHGMNYPASRFDNVLSKGRAPISVHQFFLDRGWVYKEGHVYQLQIPQLNTQSVFMVDVNDPIFRRMLIEFGEYCAENML